MPTFDPSASPATTTSFGESENTPWWAKLIGAAVTGGGLLAAAKTGNGLPALSGLVEGFASEKMKANDLARKQKFETDSALIKQAHEEVMKLEGKDVSQFPELQKLSDKYRQALAKDSPGGATITAQEAANIIAHSQIARSQFAELDKQEATSKETEKQQNVFTARQATWQKIQDQIKAAHEATQANTPSMGMGRVEGPDQGSGEGLQPPPMPPSGAEEFLQGQAEQLSPMQTVTLPNGMTIPIKAATGLGSAFVRNLGAAERQTSQQTFAHTEGELNRGSRAAIAAARNAVSTARTAQSAKHSWESGANAFVRAVKADILQSRNYKDDADILSHYEQLIPRPAAGLTPPPAAATGSSGKTVKRTGRTSTGQRVVEYTDGTIEYQ